LDLGADRADEAARYLAQNGTKASIVAVAAKHGIPSNICRAAIAMNDSFPDFERKERLLAVV
jgi:hypothetical protein